MKGVNSCCNFVCRTICTCLVYNDFTCSQNIGNWYSSHPHEINFLQPYSLKMINTVFLFYSLYTSILIGLATLVICPASPQTHVSCSVLKLCKELVGFSNWLFGMQVWKVTSLKISWISFCISGSVLCVGSEWHRFPSSFFVPDYVGEVRWIDDGFRGLLPFPFNSTLGGTASAPPYLNDKNKASVDQYVTTLQTCLYKTEVPYICYVFFRKWPISFSQLRDLEQCTFLVELQLSRPFPSRGSDLSTWEVQIRLLLYFFPNKLLWAELVFFSIQVIGALPYLDRELSPAKYRSFFIPYLWQSKNIFGMYKLLRRVPKWNLGSDRITELDSELACLVLTPPPSLPRVSSEGKPPFLMI